MTTRGASYPNVRDNSNRSVLTVELPRICSVTTRRKRGSVNQPERQSDYVTLTLCADRATENVALLAVKIQGWGVSPSREDNDPTVGVEVFVTHRLVTDFPAKWRF